MNNRDPTAEQLNIIKSLIDSNVVVDSVAGSGKTTTIKYTAMAFRRELILVLMYNVNQRTNTKEEMARLGIKNIHIHTFHSCAYRFYGQECSRDSGIRSAISDDRQPILDHYTSTDISEDEKFNMIIIDEVQDMNNLYYELSKKLIRDVCDNPRIMLVGDYLQSINSFNGSRIDYILNPDKYFDGKWTRCSLNETFRLTQPMVNLVNSVNDSFDSGFRKLVSRKQSDKLPVYYVCDMKYVYAKVCEYLAKRSPHEILLLTPSVKKDKRIAELCNLLSNDGIPIYITGEQKGDYRNRELANGKLMISTIHAIKGDERPIVMLINFDDSILPRLMSSANKNASKNVPKNTPKDAIREDSEDNASSIIYVALTRAKEELLIFHNCQNAFIVPRQIIESSCDFHIIGKLAKNYMNREYLPKNKLKSVTDLVKYLSNEVKAECMKYIIVNKIYIASENIATNVPNVVPSTIDGSVEDVSDINGFLVPAFHSRFCFDFTQLKSYFEERYSRNGLLKLVNDYISEVSEFSDDFLIDPYCGIEQLLRMATIYNGLRNQLFYKIEQIKDYDWITYKFLDKCSERLSSLISETARYEVVVQRGMIVGIIDVYDDRDGRVYELKCTSMLEEEHILQLALYAYLMPKKEYYLYNIFTNELLQLQISDPSRIAEILMGQK
jgi:hypothetical protein